MARYVSDGQLLRSEAQDAGHVHRNVAHPDDRHPLLGKIELTVTVIGMAVVPADEFGCRVAAFQVLAGNTHTLVRLCPGRVQDLMVMSPEVRQIYLLAKFDESVEAELWMGGDLSKDPGHRLDLVVIRSDAGADQAVGCRQALEHVDFDVKTVLLEQVISSVERGRSGTNNGDSQRTCISTDRWHECLHTSFRAALCCC